MLEDCPKCGLWKETKEPCGYCMLVADIKPDISIYEIIKNRKRKKKMPIDSRVCAKCKNTKMFMDVIGQRHETI